VKSRRSQPLGNYSSYIQEYETVDTEEVQPRVQKFLTNFFELRDGEESRLESLAKRLLREKTLVETVNQVEICYKLIGREFTYSFNPNPSETIYCPLAHQPLKYRKKTNITILIDAIAECETLALMGYSAH
jgi:hypothetical protein